MTTSKGKTKHKYKLFFMPEALQEWHRLDGSIRTNLKKLLAKRLDNPWEAIVGIVVRALSFGESVTAGTLWPQLTHEALRNRLRTLVVDTSCHWCSTEPAK